MNKVVSYEAERDCHIDKFQLSCSKFSKKFFKKSHQAHDLVGLLKSTIKWASQQIETLWNLSTWQLRRLNTQMQNHMHSSGLLGGLSPLSV